MEQSRKLVPGDGADLLSGARHFAGTIVVKGDRKKYAEILARLGIVMLDIADSDLRGVELRRCFDDAARKAVEEIEAAGIELRVEPVIGQCTLREYSQN